MELEDDLYGMWLVDFTRRAANVFNIEHVLNVKSQCNAAPMKPGQILNFCVIMYIHLSYLCRHVF